MESAAAQWTDEMKSTVDRQTRRHKRLQLLHRQAHLETQVCAVCPVITRSSIAGCVGCPTYAELGEIGKELDRTMTIAPPEELTFSVYLQLKERGWSDREVARTYRISNGALWEFKQDHLKIRGK